LEGSFEFHVKLAEVSKIVLTEKKGPDDRKLLRIFRMLTAEGKPICSIILSDESPEAKNWYEEMLERYGSEIQL
jgi:hypothetical protein